MAKASIVPVTVIRKNKHELAAKSYVPQDTQVRREVARHQQIIDKHERIISDLRGNQIVVAQRRVRNGIKDIL